LLLGPPKSGKREMLKRLGHPFVLDFAKIATTGNWLTPRSAGDVIALNHFEFGVDSADINAKKLEILESLVHVQHKQIILLSTVDPLYYLNAGCPDTLVSGETKDLAQAIKILDRWAVVLSTFQKVGVEDITSRNLCQAAEHVRGNYSDRDLCDFADYVMAECNHSAQLRSIGIAILNEYQQYRGLSKEQLVRELLERADSYYRVLWSTCTRNERLVLYQLAQDGWANPKNRIAIQQLERRKLIVVPPQVSDKQPWPWARDLAASRLKGPAGVRIMNESFRQYVSNSQQRDEVEAWEREGEQSVWRFLKLSLGILAMAGAAWLLYSQQQFFNTVVAYMGALGAAAGVVFKLVSDLRSKSSAPSSA
jgi:hypothetical protein